MEMDRRTEQSIGEARNPLEVLRQAGAIQTASENLEQENREMLKFWGERDPVAEERLARIDEEIGRLRNHPWAGRYYMGDGYGMNVNLWLAPQNGFVFEWHGCLKLYDRNVGAVRSERNQIELMCERSIGAKLREVGIELRVVKWGGRVYLIPTAKMEEFLAAVYRKEPRESVYGFYLLRWGDEKKPVSGRPQVGAEGEK